MYACTNAPLLSAVIDRQDMDNSETQLLWDMIE